MAFYGYSYGFTSITIPSSVTSIGDNAFYGCSGLTNITIPKSVISIGNAAFGGCNGITSIIIERGNPNYDSRDNCNAIIETATNTLIAGFKNTVIPNTVTSIGDEAFSSCDDLTSIFIPEGVKRIGYMAFIYCYDLTSINIPNSITDIGAYAFDLTGLTSVIIPDGITIVKECAFANCESLSSVSIGRGVKSIEWRAFSSLPMLKDVYCYAEEVPHTYSLAFDDTPISSATLHVPQKSVDLYKTASPWSSFREIVPIEPDVTRCATPTIGYAGGKLTFKCETEGVTFIYNIKDDDIKYGAGSEVNLSVAYQISVYATKGGIADSEVATATLCWVDQQPEAEGLTGEDAVLEMKAQPVLIQTQGGTISVKGIDNGMEVSAYSVDGKKEGFAISEAGQAVVNTNLTSGSIAVVKIGEKAIKVQIK